jgi:CRP-like cAMP-binding protein
MSANAKVFCLSSSPSPQNSILSALEPEDYRLIHPHLEPVQLRLNQAVYESGDTVRYVYFPRSCVLSDLAVLEDGTTIEVGMIGSLGLAGSAVVLGDSSATCLTVVEIEGEAYRFRTGKLVECCRLSDTLNRMILTYYRALSVQYFQRAACNCRHTILQRLSAWLLMVHDCIRSDELPLTQDLISRRLGSRRASVTLAYDQLQTGGCIRYTRGQLTILNRMRLECLACECYRIIRDETQKVFKPTGRSIKSPLRLQKVR